MCCANAATTSGSAENARLPIARLPRPRSTTGAKLRSTPVARIFAGHQPRVLAANASAAVGSRPIQRIEALQRRQRAIALAETLHAPAFLVHADQLRPRRRLANGRVSSATCARRGEVAREQDHADTGVVLQPVALLRSEFVYRRRRSAA
jgi:hypothetical protein